MAADLITSRANPLIRELRALSQRKTRAERGAFLVEGIQLVLQALATGTAVQMLVVAPDLLTSSLAHDAVRRAERRQIRIVRVAGTVFQSFAERDHPTGLAAVVKIPSGHLNELRVTPTAMFVALYEVSNPGNLGTIIRTADAVGAGGVLLIGTTTDPYAPAAVNATRGALFTVPVVHLSDPAALLTWCQRHSLRLVTASDRAEQIYWEADLGGPVVLTFGSEGKGLPPALAGAGHAVRIPMAGAVDSLNLAIAAGVLLYECVRQRTIPS